MGLLPIDQNVHVMFSEIDHIDMGLVQVATALMTSDIVTMMSE